MGTQQQIAHKLGFSDRWLRKLVEAGAVKEAVRNAWDAIEVARQLLAYYTALVEKQKAEIASLNSRLAAAEGSSANKADEDARLAKARADKAEMEVAEMRGQLIPSGQVAEVLHGAVIIMKTRLNGIPAKAAPLAHGAPSAAAAERIIRDHVDEALAELGKAEIIGPAEKTAL